MAKINETGDEWIVEPEPIVMPIAVPEAVPAESEPELVPVG